MQVPKRKSQENRKYGETDDVYLTAAAIQDLKDELRTLERFSRPRTVEELSRAREMGDLSENAEYQEARDDAWDTFIGSLENLAAGELKVISTNLSNTSIFSPL